MRTKNKNLILFSILLGLFCLAQSANSEEIKSNQPKNVAQKAVSQKNIVAQCPQNKPANTWKPSEKEQQKSIKEQVKTVKTNKVIQSGIVSITQPAQNGKIPSVITLDIPKDSVPITYEESLQIALKNNFDVKIIATQKERDKWTYYNSLSEFLPDISYNYTQTKLNGTFLIGGAVLIPINEQSISNGFTAQLPVFTGFRRYYDARYNKYNYQASKKRLDLTQEQVLLLTTVQYYTLLQNKLNIEILTKALEQTESQLKLNRQRFEAGVGTKFDVLRSEAEVAAASQNLISAENSMKLSQAQLANTLGINVFAPVIPLESDVATKTLFKDCFDLNKITEIAIKNKPDIEIAKLNIESARARKNSAYSTYLPTVTFQTSVNGSGNAISTLNQNNSVGFSVNWIGLQNMGLGGYTAIKALDAQLDEAKLRFSTTTRNLAQNLISSYYNVIDSKELIDAAGKQVTSADESLRLSVVRLESGVGIYTDVIAAQLTATQARINYLNAIIKYNIAQAQLLFDMGVISPNNLLEGIELQNEANKAKK